MRKLMCIATSEACGGLVPLSLMSTVPYLKHPRSQLLGWTDDSTVLYLSCKRDMCETLKQPVARLVLSALLLRCCDELIE